jgi:Acetyltransferase (GNAT) domain
MTDSLSEDSCCQAGTGIAQPQEGEAPSLDRILEFGQQKAPLAGYTHPDYAASLAGFGTPRRLPRSNGWILERQIPGTPYKDAIGPYPLFSCRDWSQLNRDLGEIGAELVSLMLVPAPFDGYSQSVLEEAFTDVRPFKSHYVTDLTMPVDKIVKKSHRDTVARAVKKVQVSHCTEPLTRLAEWVGLFEVLTKRHAITGIRAFSPDAFAKQLATPGMVMFEAKAGGETVGLDLWYKQGDVAYGHLVAFSERGYQLRASYATKWFMLNYFVGKVRWVDFGGGAGVRTNGADGLTVYKDGWSTGTVPVYLCGRIFDPAVYNSLTEAAGTTGSAYFPAYRAGNPL